MRLRIIYLSFISLFIFLVGCLFYLQIIKGPIYREMSYRNSIRLLNVPATRGIIYDRLGRVLAEDSLSFGVFIIPQEAADIDGVILKISKLLDVKESLLKRNYKRNYIAPFAPCEIIKGISKKDAIIIEELKLDMKGVLVKEIPLRNYPFKEAFSHVVGYVGEIDKEELEIFGEYGYAAKDLLGKNGVEKIANHVLRGKSGGMQVQVDNKGHQVEVLSHKKARKGKDVTLTLDSSLQSFIWDLMKDEKGAAIVMDPNNGEVLALVSVPSYDPNESLGNILRDVDAPLINRAIMGQYSPGSLFKLVIALAGLESGVINFETTFECHGKIDMGGSLFHCWNRDGHGPMNIKNAITQSCNVYFYNLGLRLGLEKILEYAVQFGFGKETGIELSGEEKGFLPTRPWKRTAYGMRWFAGDTLNLSIGQGYLLITPMQLARFISSIANGGELVQPHVIKSGDLNMPSKLRIRKENIDIVKKGMRGVVEGEHGTGHQAWSEKISIAGKTGTSQTGDGTRTHAWFGGFAPIDNPEISFVVFLEHGGSGGDLPAFIVRQVVEYWSKSIKK
ncbi:MAG: penicillin-binding protein 2 [Candidatus Omnitrophota bacterium]